MLLFIVSVYNPYLILHSIVAYLVNPFYRTKVTQINFQLFKQSI
jgi:hypothetical protein